jgi:kynurenine formamidase
MFKNQIDTSFVGFTTDGAKWLVDNTDIKLVGKLLTFFNLALLFFSYVFLKTSIHMFFFNVGIDYLAVAAWSDLVPAHLVLLKSRVRLMQCKVIK